MIPILEYVLACTVLAFLITQILIPFGRGTKLFPIFSKESKLNDKMAEVKQEIVEKKLEKEINNLKK